MKKYDIHVAGEDGGGDTAAFKRALASLGFTDDNLAERGLTFDPETDKHYTACPLINVHASMKVSAHPDDLNMLEKTVDELMRDHRIIGYWHSEFIEDDQRIEPTGQFALQSLPFTHLLSRPRNEKKKWDIHMSMQQDTMPEELGDVLLSNGLYYMARNKKIADTEARFAVYTVQGINSAKEGRIFFGEMCEWLRMVNAPPCDIKLEITRNMELVNDPRAVPPTIDHINWVE